MPKQTLKRKDANQNKDLLQIVKKNEFIERYTTSEMDITSSKYIFWRDHVVPSCFPVSSRLCCFVCCKNISSLPVLIRHYREQHQELIPEGIFGAKLEFVCSLCQVAFSRKEHLINHFISDLHSRKNKENNFIMSENILEIASDATAAAHKRTADIKVEEPESPVKRPKIFHFITSSPEPKIEEVSFPSQQNHVETSKLSDIENLDCWDSDTDLDLLTTEVLDEISKIEEKRQPPSNLRRTVTINDLAGLSDSESSLDSLIYFDKKPCPSSGQKFASNQTTDSLLNLSSDTLDYVTPKERENSETYKSDQEGACLSKKIERSLSDFMIKKLSFD